MTYPERPTRIEVVETHMSYVFLTPEHAYKLKKPVRYDYLDFSTLAAREHNCREDLTLNQALAPGIYVDVVSLAVGVRGRLSVGGAGETAEWLVKMRRLPAECMLDQRLHGRTATTKLGNRNLTDIKVSEKWGGKDDCMPSAVCREVIHGPETETSRGAMVSPPQQGPGVPGHGH